MKPIVLHPGSIVVGIALAGIGLFVASAQTQVEILPHRQPREVVIRSVAYAPERLELIPVANYADDPGAVVVTVQPYERLLLLGPWNGSALPANILSVPLQLNPAGNGYVTLNGTTTVAAGPQEGGVPSCWLDHGSYILAVNSGMNGNSNAPRSYLIGYRVEL